MNNLIMKRIDFKLIKPILLFTFDHLFFKCQTKPKEGFRHGRLIASWSVYYLPALTSNYNVDISRSFTNDDHSQDSNSNLTLS